MLEMDAKGFLPLGFVPQQVHLARFRDAAASMTQTVSSLRSLRTLRGATESVLREAGKVADSCPLPSTTYSGLRLTEFSAAFPKRTKWIFALGRPSPRLS